MKTPWIRWTLLAQVVFFLAWAGWEEWRRTEAPVVILETLPVDPRDLLAGKYLQLRFAVGDTARLPGFPSGEVPLGRPVWVLLKRTGEIRAGGHVEPLWTAAACQVTPPERPGGKEEGYWVRGTYLGGRNVSYGIERYYFNEKRSDEWSMIRSGQVWVEAQVGKDGRLALKDLID